MFLVIAIPRPVPPIPFSVTVCSLVNESNTCSLNSGDIPIPLSFTLNTTVVHPSLLHGFSETRMLTVPPTGVNFTALLLIFRSTCVRRNLSVMISSWSTSCVSIYSSCCLECTDSCIIVFKSCKISGRCTTVYSIRTEPFSILLISSTSLIRLSRC